MDNETACEGRQNVNTAFSRLLVRLRFLSAKRRNVTNDGQPFHNPAR